MGNFYLIIFLVLSFLVSENLFAKRPFQKIAIPGAVCGDGKQYYIYLDLKSEEKLVAEFAGGGACWNYASCQGVLGQGLTTLHMKRPYKNYTVPSDNESMSPVADYSFIYFPYCTGDVHSGRHIASYKSKLGIKKKVSHVGYLNVEKSIEYLIDNGLINFNAIKKFVITGPSAGAIGAMIHTMTFDKVLPSDTEKYLLADAPGLHFGPRFWKKFSNTMVENFRTAFNSIGADFSEDDGNIVQYLPDISSTLSNWHLGFIQSSKDIVMSLVFGNITPKQHKEMVLGKNGLIKVCDAIENCEAWVPNSYKHTFLKKKKHKKRKYKGETAYQFFKEFIEE